MHFSFYGFPKRNICLIYVKAFFRLLPTASFGWPLPHTPATLTDCESNKKRRCRVLHHLHHPKSHSSQRGYTMYT